MGQKKITNFDPNWAFPDCNSSDMSNKKAKKPDEEIEKQVSEECQDWEEEGAKGKIEQENQPP